MMIKLGNFLFRYRNGLFPLAYLLIFFRGAKLFDNDLLAALIGFLVALAGQALRAQTIGLAYIVRGGRNRQVYANDLVTGGLFAHCRNPLYVGNYLILVGIGIAANGWLFTAIGLPCFFVAYWAIILAEENYLRNKFGQAFDDYCKRVPRILMNFRGLPATIHSMEFKWRRLIVKEYGLTYAWTAGMALVVIRNIWADAGYQASHHAIQALIGALVVLTLAYAIARFLKKKQILRAEAATPAKA